MADFTAWQPQPQTTPLQTLSQVLGIKQAQQNLQTGAIQQQAAQAESEQAQQKNAELQAVGKLTSQAYSSGHYKAADGSFDNQKFANDVSSVAPVYGQQIANDATARAGEIYHNQQTLLNLTNDQRKTIGDSFGAMAADPSIDHGKFIDQVESLRDQLKDNPGVSRMLTSIATAMPNTSGPQLQQALRNAAVAANSPSAAQTNPGVGTYQGVNGVQPYQTNPQAVGGVKNIGAPLGPQGLSPTDQIAYQAARAGATTSASTRAAGSGSADIDTSNQVVSALKDAKTNIDLTHRIDQLADVVAPGALPEKVRSGLGALGLQDVNQAQTELEKDLGRLRGPLAARAGSDSRAAEALEGLPTVKTPTQTIHQAMDFTRGVAKQDLALGQLRDKNAKETGSNMTGFQGDYAHAVSAASPLMHEYLSLSPQDQVGFFQRNFKTKAQAQAFRAQAEAVKKMSPDVFGQ